MGENIQDLLNKIKSWRRESEVWSYICAISSVVGLLCFALSSSSNDFIGEWSWWRTVIYVAFSFIFCYFTWFSNEWQRSISPRLKGRVAFVLLMITNVYSSVFDEREKKKPDAYILISYAAFAIMSLSLCTLGPLGTDLLYFFCGLLLIQVMKINIWLAIVAGIFDYSLIKLSSSEDAIPQDQDQDLESGSRRPLTNSSVSPVDSHQANINGNHNAQLQADPIAEDDGEEEDISASDSDSDHHLSWYQ